MLDALILGHDDRHAALVEQAADELVGAALDDLDDLAFGPAATVGAGDAREHAIAVQHLAHLVLRQHEIVATVVADQKSEAVAMALHLARNQVGARGDEQQAGPVAHDAPGALELVELGVESASRARQLSCRRPARSCDVSGDACSGQGLHDEVAQSMRVGIFLFKGFFCSDLLCVAPPLQSIEQRSAFDMHSSPLESPAHLCPGGGIGRRTSFRY